MEISASFALRLAGVLTERLHGLARLRIRSGACAVRRQSLVTSRDQPSAVLKATMRAGCWLSVRSRISVSRGVAFSSIRPTAEIVQIDLDQGSASTPRHTTGSYADMVAQ